MRLQSALCPRPHWGAYIAPDPIAGFHGPLRDRGGEERGVEGRAGKEEKGGDGVGEKRSLLLFLQFNH